MRTGFAESGADLSIFTSGGGAGGLQACPAHSGASIPSPSGLTQYPRALNRLLKPSVLGKPPLFPPPRNSWLPPLPPLLPYLPLPFPNLCIKHSRGHFCLPTPPRNSLAPLGFSARAVDLCCLYPPDQLAATSSWAGSTSPRLALGPSTSAPNGSRMSPALPLGSGQGQRRGGEAGGGAADAVDAVAAEQEAREAQSQVGRRSQRRWLTLRLAQSKCTHTRTMCLYIPTCRLQGSAVLDPLFVYASNLQSERQRSLFARLCAHTRRLQGRRPPTPSVCLSMCLAVCLSVCYCPQTAREAVQSEVALRVERAALLPAARRDQRPSGTASQTLVRRRGVQGG